MQDIDRKQLEIALCHVDKLFLEIYSNAQKLTWEDIEELGRDGLKTMKDLFKQHFHHIYTSIYKE